MCLDVPCTSFEMHAMHIHAARGAGAIDVLDVLAHNLGNNRTAIQLKPGLAGRGLAHSNHKRRRVEEPSNPHGERQLELMGPVVQLLDALQQTLVPRSKRLLGLERLCTPQRRHLAGNHGLLQLERPRSAWDGALELEVELLERAANFGSQRIHHHALVEEHGEEWIVAAIQALRLGNNRRNIKIQRKTLNNVVENLLAALHTGLLGRRTRKTRLHADQRRQNAVGKLDLTVDLGIQIKPNRGRALLLQPCLHILRILFLRQARRSHKPRGELEPIHEIVAQHRLHGRGADASVPLVCDMATVDHIGNHVLNVGPWDNAARVEIRRNNVRRVRQIAHRERIWRSPALGPIALALIRRSMEEGQSKQNVAQLHGLGARAHKLLGKSAKCAQQIGLEPHGLRHRDLDRHFEQGHRNRIHRGRRQEDTEVRMRGERQPVQQMEQLRQELGRKLHILQEHPPSFLGPDDQRVFRNSLLAAAQRHMPELARLLEPALDCNPLNIAQRICASGENKEHRAQHRGIVVDLVLEIEQRHPRHEPPPELLCSKVRDCRRKTIGPQRADHEQALKRREILPLKRQALELRLLVIVPLPEPIRLALHVAWQLRKPPNR
eukprot:comp21612_c0_seq1/m.47645 comp21612_c0_seq1/g.47645  ORF comp21612_c0_seq1/g.47645 comp21612_c0_seq1/m.47645 type:complete len:607 (-) comp21612_c0_seq1:793-2613(-)